MAFDVIQADVIAHLRGNQWLVQNGHIPKAHAVLCDPPYGLAFMGKEWDTLGAVEFQTWVTEWAALLLDYVYPGALLMAFGGTRTYHRLAAGLEDAGWEIGDSMAWVYAQGFPKSAALDKLLDREAGATREVSEWYDRYQDGRTRTEQPSYSHVAISNPANGNMKTAPATPLAARWQGYGTALKPAWENVVIARAPRGNRTYAALAREFGTGALAIDAGRIGTGAKMWAEPRGGICPPNSAADAPLIDNPSGRWPANFALVCACEGDDHADDCPVKVLGEQSGERPGNSNKNLYSTDMNNQVYGKFERREMGGMGRGDTGTAARFFYQAKASAWEREAGLHDRARRNVNPGHNLSTNACARCGKRVKANGSGDKCECGDLRETVKVSDRANVHPTVKPIRLAEYLARLILPPVLDEPRRLLIPFAGSGSEMVGALLAGWDIVTGIERETEYAELARARVGWWAQFSTYDEARAAYENGRKAQQPAGRTVGPTRRRYEVLTCPEHGEPALKIAGNRRYACGCALVYGKREAPAPVVVAADDTPTQYALFDERTG